MTQSRKRTLFAGCLGIATVAIMASCSNDTTSTDDRATAMADSTAKMSADAQKAVAKKRKGMASAMVSADNAVKIEKGKDGVYSKAEKMPEYPGGEPALSKFVENNIAYPQDAIDQNKEGTVNVSFVIDEKGKVTNPVATGATTGNGLDEEAIKIVKQMPDWTPGMVKGKAVKTRLLLPVTFKLSDG
ncbi:MAG: energy transducer TonB [Chitinophagaceae bacterium]